MTVKGITASIAAAMCILAVAGCARPPVYDSPATGRTTAPPSDMVTVALYFADANGAALARTQVQIPSSEATAAGVLRLLVGGPPQESDAMAVIPNDTRINGVQVRDGLALVDLSSAFRDKFPSGSNIGYLCVYSIVHTLCELPDIDRVQILIDGRKVSSLGQVDVSAPLTPDPEIIAGGN